MCGTSLQLIYLIGRDNFTLFLIPQLNSALERIALQLQNFVTCELGDTIMKKNEDLQSDRGRIETIKHKRTIKVNGQKVTTATIEIDHINFGLNTKTGNLNASKRTNFTVNDIEKFLMLLDGEEIIANKYKGKKSQHFIRINCPI